MTSGSRSKAKRAYERTRTKIEERKPGQKGYAAFWRQELGNAAPEITSLRNGAVSGRSILSVMNVYGSEMNNDTGESRLGQKALAARSAMTERTVRRVQTWAKENGWLDEKNRGVPGVVGKRVVLTVGWLPDVPDNTVRQGKNADVADNPVRHAEEVLPDSGDDVPDSGDEIADSSCPMNSQIELSVQNSQREDPSISTPGEQNLGRFAPSVLSSPDDPEAPEDKEDKEDKEEEMDWSKVEKKPCGCSILGGSCPDCREERQSVEPVEETCSCPPFSAVSCPVCRSKRQKDSKIEETCTCPPLSGVSCPVCRPKPPKAMQAHELSDDPCVRHGGGFVTEKKCQHCHNEISRLRAESKHPEFKRRDWHEDVNESEGLAPDGDGANVLTRPSRYRGRRAS